MMIANDKHEYIPYSRQWGAAVLLLLISILMVYLYLSMRVPIVTVHANPGPTAVLPVDVQQRVQVLQGAIGRLETEIAARQAGDALAACPPGTGRTDEPAGRADVQGSSSTGGAAPAPGPASGVAEGASGQTVAALSREVRVRILEQATALVIAGDSIATGFFIAPDLLVTNRHAVEEGAGGRIMVASRSLGTALEAHVIGASPAGPVGAVDFALVRLNAGRAKGVLSVSTRFAKLSDVTAAGYPGLTVMKDAGFRRLVAGDLSAAPDLNVNPGAVQAIQSLSNGMTAIAHTASILQGNSGGPLIDDCGRVIGVNTFIAVDQEQSGKISYAQPTPTLLAFLNQHGVPLQPDDRACSPR